LAPRQNPIRLHNLSSQRNAITGRLVLLPLPSPSVLGLAPAEIATSAIIPSLFKIKRLEAATSPELRMHASVKKRRFGLEGSIRCLVVLLSRGTHERMRIATAERLGGSEREKDFCVNIGGHEQQLSGFF
jgi:hypothetical protein